jgi:hypothetical protein
VRLPSRTLWIFAALVMFTVPLAADLSRSSGYVATIKLFPVDQVGFARRTDLHYPQRLLETPAAALVLRQQASKSAIPASTHEVQLLRSIGWGARSRRHYRTVSARVTAATPGQASQSAINVMLAIEYASGIDLLPHVRRRLEHVRGDPALRRALREFTRRPQSRYAIKHGPTVVRGGAGTVDRLIADLPGRIQERPLPLAAAFAGLLLTAGMWLAATARLPTALVRSRSRRRP